MKTSNTNSCVSLTSRGVNQTLLVLMGSMDESNRKEAHFVEAMNASQDTSRQPKQNASVSLSIVYSRISTCFAAHWKKKAARTRSTPNLTSGHFGVRGFITAFLLPKACATTETQWYRYPGFEQLACVRARNVYVVDGNAYFNRPAPRLVDSLEMLAHFLHPNLHRFPENVQPIHRVMPTVRS